MLIFGFLAVFLILLFWAALVYVRKTMWDAVHRNLLDLEDHYQGEVIRRGFASRPIFRGKFNKVEITINFSTERIKNGRLNYIDISYAKTVSSPLTISRKNWLVNQDTRDISDYEEVKSSQQQDFMLMPKSDKLVQNLVKSERFLDLLDQFENLAYIFIGRTGIICEYVSEQMVPDTKFEVMEKRLKLLDSLVQEIEVVSP